MIAVIAESTLLQALETAQAVAREAGEYLRGKQGAVKVVAKKALRDELLDADIGAEEIILQALRKNFPEYDILSEETPAEKQISSFRWIVDPLDGSFNFQHGNPTFAVSIGLLVDDIMQVSVVYLPLLREMFTAIRDRGAYLNGKPIHVSDNSNLDKAIVHVGDFAKDGNRQENEAVILSLERLANAVGRIRMIGTAATDLAYVACGRAEALVIHNALPWDIEIGRLLVKEAGGDITFHNGIKGTNLAICGNEHVHRLLLTIFREKHDRFEPDYEYSYGYE